MSATEIPPTGAPKRRWRWPTVLLVASLGLNLLVLGVVAGRALHHGPGGPVWMMGGRMFGGLPDDRRDAVRAIIDRHAPELKTAWRAMREERERAMDAFRTEPYSAPDLEASLQRLQQAETALRAKTTPMITEIAGVLSPEERGRVLKHLRRHVFGRWHGGLFGGEGRGP